MWMFRTPVGGQELYFGPNLRILKQVMVGSGPATFRSVDKLAEDFPGKVIRNSIRDGVWRRMSWIPVHRGFTTQLVKHAAKARPATRVNWRCLLRRYPKMDPKFLALCKLG